MKKYTQQGYDFLEVDVEDDCSYINVTRGGTPLVLIRDNSDRTIINIVTWPGKEIDPRLNNQPI